MTDEATIIPRVLGVNMAISFFDETQDPVLVLNCILQEDALTSQLAHHGGVEGQCVVPLAFAPEHLKDLVGQIVEGTIRANVLREMVTIWPEQRDEIIQNLLFRWTATLEPGQDGGDGESET